MGGLINSVGNPVEGEGRFWDREAEIARFIELLDNGASILLIAQRRIGKTSLMREVRRRVQDRYLCLWADLQSYRTSAEVVASLGMETRPHADLWGKTKSVFGNVLNSVADRLESFSYSDWSLRLRDGMAGEDWRVKGNALFDILASANREAVLFLDEVPILVNHLLTQGDGEITPEGRLQADMFMSWLRENATRYAHRIRLVITGSIGLEPILHRARLSATINHLTPFELTPWSKEIAIGCLHALADEHGLCFETGACECIVERLGACIPHHVQMYFGALCDFRSRRADGSNAISIADVHAVYDDAMLGLRGHAELAHYEERLRSVLGKESSLVAIALLTYAAARRSLPRSVAPGICAACHPEDADETLREVLDVLLHDGYLRRHGDGYVFVSSFLRDWWHRRFPDVLTPTPEEA